MTVRDQGSEAPTVPANPHIIPLNSFTDFLDNEIFCGTHVVVAQRDGNSQRAWSAQVIDIGNFGTQYTKGSDLIRVRVEATGFYTKYGSQHGWPTELDHMTGKQRRTGKRPRPTWVDSDKVFLSPHQDNEKFLKKVLDSR